VCTALDASTPVPTMQEWRMADEPLTVTLRAAHAGDRQAADRAYAVLYPELLKIARARLRVHAQNTLLDTESLVHESFLRFIAADKLGIADRKHFFTYAAKTMRNIVIDFARHRSAERHGGAVERVTLSTDMFGASRMEDAVLDIDRALRELEALDPRLSTVVEMRYFGGNTDAEIAATLGVTERTIRRDWEKARAFILDQMQP
jgi:RNA polymerase sigma factor (TIGR02999 family)